PGSWPAGSVRAAAQAASAARRASWAAAFGSDEACAEAPATCTSGAVAASASWRSRRQLSSAARRASASTCAQRTSEPARPSGPGASLLDDDLPREAVHGAHVAEGALLLEGQLVALHLHRRLRMLLLAEGDVVRRVAVPRPGDRLALLDRHLVRLEGVAAVRALDRHRMLLLLRRVAARRG